MHTPPGLQLPYGAPMPRTPVRDGLCRLSSYLEELEAAELKKFKLYLRAAPELGERKVPWGRMESAGPLEMAQLLGAHCGAGDAWLLALSIFERIHRRDLWERGQREDLERGKGPREARILLPGSQAWVPTPPLGLCSDCGRHPPSLSLL